MEDAAFLLKCNGARHLLHSLTHVHTVHEESNFRNRDTPEFKQNIKLHICT